MKLEPHDRVVVLGGSGFIGSHLVPALADAGYAVTNYDLYEPIATLPAQVEDVRGDIRDLDRLTETLSSAAAVLNLAAAHHDFGLSEATFESVNVDGAKTVVAAMEAAGVENLCFYSSVAVYGEQPGEPDENTVPDPANVYGRTKFAAEAIYRAWEDAGSGRRVLVIRPAVVFGPRNYANMFRLIDQIARRRFFPVGPGANRKAMVYVENVVAAIQYLWQREPAHRPEVYNFVDSPHQTSRAIIDAIYVDLGRRPLRMHLPLRPAVIAAKPLDWIARATGKNLAVTAARIEKIGNAETVFDSQRLRDSGFVPVATLREGLARMVRWYSDEGRSARVLDHLPAQNSQGR